MPRRDLRPDTLRRVSATAAVVMVLVAGTGCSSDNSSSPSISAQSDPADYCAQVVRLSGERPESYIGSAEQRADIGRLIAVAPSDVMGPLTTFAEFLDSGAVTAEDPESNVVENWRPDVQEAIKEITSYNEASC